MVISKSKLAVEIVGVIDSVYGTINKYIYMRKNKKGHGGGATR